MNGVSLTSPEHLFVLTKNMDENLFRQINFAKGIWRPSHISHESVF
ncbi:hypothetical protein MAMP_00511 [Methylophaga aminisulfidivorans MP]|uniref:Uncharacterized protein n=1 Tax=Methylophaga aminisulfidivorans MP TaxID=1026882 RepID=F5T274_9GAMM|nr:hypothetical protein MAMP_00511 [Methylophaga aminisulfidivorans MP]